MANPYPVAGYRTAAARERGSGLSNAADSLRQALENTSPLNQAIRETERRQTHPGRSTIPASSLGRRALGAGANALPPVQLVRNLLSAYSVLSRLAQERAPAARFFPGYIRQNICQPRPDRYGRTLDGRTAYTASLGCLDGQAVGPSLEAVDSPLTGAYTSSTGLALWTLRNDGQLPTHAATLEVWKKVPNPSTPPANGPGWHLQTFPEAGAKKHPDPGKGGEAAGRSAEAGDKSSSQQQRDPGPSEEMSPNLDPFALPIGKAVPVLPNLTPAQLKIVAEFQNPERSPNEQPSRGPAPAPQPEPVEAPAPTLEDVPAFQVYPLPQPLRERHVWKPERSPVRVRKVGVSRWILFLVGIPGELMDSLDAVYKALPAKLRARERKIRHNKDPNPIAKAELIYKYWRFIDGEQAIFNLIWEQYVSDYLYGKSGQLAKNPFAKHLPGGGRSLSSPSQAADVDWDYRPGTLPTNPIQKWLWEKYVGYTRAEGTARHAQNVREAQELFQLMSAESKARRAELRQRLAEQR